MAETSEEMTLDLLAFPRAGLLALGAALLRAQPDDGATFLQEAGFAGGEAMLGAFRERLAARGGPGPEELDADTFAAETTAFFRELGWGSIEFGTVDDVVATLDAEDWAEASATASEEHPSCHFTTGMFADFFGRIADTPLAVLEVECRSTGAPRCRFLLGSAEVMEHVYDELGRGVGYEEALR